MAKGLLLSQRASHVGQIQFLIGLGCKCGISSCLDGCFMLNELVWQCDVLHTFFMEN